MKAIIMKTTPLAAVALGFIMACNVAVAKDEPVVVSLKETLGKVPAAEVPAKAADLVAQAKPSERDAITADVVTVALKKNPTMAAAIVGATSRKSPEAASVAAATAASLQPKQAKLIAQAAAAAAPSKAGNIVKAVCKAVPSAYREVAVAVSQVAPNSAKEILAGLSEALPTLANPIEQAMVTYNGQVLSVVAVLDRVPDSSGTVTSGTTIAAARPPTITGPYVPLSRTPTNAGPGTVVPPGGRDYARP